MEVKNTKIRYLKIPYDFLARCDLRIVDKLLWQHFSNFKGNGCYQNNNQLAKTFGVSIKTVSRSIGRLKRISAIIIYSPKGFYRRIWSEKYKEQAQEKIRELREKSKYYKSISVGQNDPVS